MRPKVLVTGGAGFIGSHVADDLIRDGCQVVVLDDLSGGFKANVSRQALFVEGSITDAALVKEVFAEHKFDYVFHLAAYAAEGLSHFIKAYNYDNNLVGSIHLINASINQGVKCFVFTSSIAVYGDLHPPMREETAPRPDDPYGIAKFAVEQELRICKKMFGMDYIIFRPHNVYGERQNIKDKFRNVIGIFMRQAMEGTPMTIFGDGGQTRAFSHVRDVSPIIARSIFTPRAFNEIFNIGADTPYSVRDLAQKVAEAMGVEPRIQHLAERNEVKHAYSSHDKLRSVFGTQACLPLEDGLRGMARWAKSAVHQASRMPGSLDVSKNMPASWLDHYQPSPRERAVS